MKKFIYAFSTGLCCLLLSCTNKSSDTGTSTDNNGTNSKAEQMKQLNHDIIKAIETGDSSKLGFISSDAVDHNGGPNGSEMKGDSIKHFLMDWHNHISDLKFNIVSDAVDTVNNYVYTWSTMSGTTKDASMGMPANTKFDFKSVDIVKYKDGKFTDHWGYMDPNDMMKMMSQGNPGSMKNDKKTK